MGKDKANSFWQKLKDFFTISDKDLNAWKKRNYESRQQMGLTTQKEDEKSDEEYEKKNRRD